jgi:hypothetical protein
MYHRHRHRGKRATLINLYRMSCKQLLKNKILSLVKTCHSLTTKNFGLLYVSDRVNSMDVMPCSLFNIFVSGGGINLTDLTSSSSNLSP